MSQLAARWCRAVPSLHEAGLRVGYMRAEFAAPLLEEFAEALDEICARAEQASPVAREVLTATAPLFIEPADDRIDALRRIAEDRSLLALGRFLRRRKPTPPPQSSAQAPRLEPPDTPATARHPSGRTLTLGERKALARKPSRASLEKLVLDPHPDVLRQVLGNPRLTEDDVVRIAARRPASALVLAEIAKSTRWAHKPRVRMALVQNPGTPLSIAVPLVGLLIRPELAEVVAAADVAPLVRATATELLERRPPVPFKPSGPLQ